MALEITDRNFEETVLKSDKLTVIDFWAEWCGPCRVVGPIVEQLGRDYAGQAVVGS
jgi:thioredoxin 1